MTERLISLIESYSEGDLVAASEIIDAATEVAEHSPTLTGALAAKIADRFRSAIRTGDHDAITAGRDEWIAALRGVPRETKIPGDAATPRETVSPTGAAVPRETTSPTDAAIPPGGADAGPAAEALAFLGSATGHLSAIVDMLKRYTDGDLTLATEILAETQQLATDGTTPDEALPIIRRIRDVFFEHVRAGALATTPAAADETDATEDGPAPVEEVAAEDAVPGAEAPEPGEEVAAENPAPGAEDAAPAEEVAAEAAGPGVEDATPAEGAAAEDAVPGAEAPAPAEEVATEAAAPAAENPAPDTEAATPAEAVATETAVPAADNPAPDTEAATPASDPAAPVEPITIDLDEPRESEPREMEHQAVEPRETTQRARPAARARVESVEPAQPHEVPVDDLDVITSFLQEAVDHLDDIEHRVLTLEDAHDDSLVNSIFRSIHTIKGVASFVGFSYVSETSHELETLLDDVRDGKQEVGDSLITVLLDGTDTLAQIVHAIEAQVAAAGETPPPSLVEESFGHREIVARVRRIRGEGDESDGGDAASAGGFGSLQADLATGATADANAPLEHAAVAAPDAGARPADAAPPEAPLVNLDDAPVVTREMIDAFIEESTDLLDQVEQELLGSEAGPIPAEGVDPIFRAIHTVKGNAGFFWFGRVEERCMEMESALDAYRQRGASIDRTAAGALLDQLDSVRQAVTQVATAAESTGGQAHETGGATGGASAAAARSDSAASDSAGADGTAEGAQPQSGQSALGEILVQMGEIDEESLKRALTRQQRRLGEILVTEEHVTPDSVDRALAEQAKRRTATPTVGAEYSVQRKDIRVDTNKLDKLFDLVGELITAESMVLSGLNGSASGHANGNGDGSGVAKAASYLQKITREMQEITLSIRMIPLEATFGKMRRLVRDLARRFEKDVTIRISGEQTEMDKNVIEEISDPLVHIIRNAIDHGIENAAARTAAGKPATGTIDLSARHEGNEIWITIADDGKGLNRDKILAKAIQRGLVQENDPELTDEQVYRFIFEPAFSTADQVSEISGRGVGMDVVRQNVEKLRGKIDLRSEPGVGTTFVLRIPLTLAILDGVTFSIAGTHFSVPTTDLVTFQSYDESLITRTSAEHHGFRLREEVIPIIQYEDREVTGDHGVVIVLQSNGRRAALVVDEIVGYRQFVVRAMPAYIQSMRAVSGCSIQGDGSISFIIDVAELMSQELERVGSR